MIAHTYKYMTPANLEIQSVLIISRVSDNPLFDSVKEKVLLSLAPAQKSFSSAKLAADKHGGEDRIELRETCRVTLVAELYFSSLIVEAFAKSDPSVIEASGYVLRKSKSKAAKKDPTLVTTPLNFSVVDISNKAGFILLSWLPVEGVRTYQIEERVKHEAVWRTVEMTTNESIELSGYAHDSLMEFRCRAIGLGEDKSDWTPILGVLIS